MASSHNHNRSSLLTGELRKTVFLLALPVLCEQFLSFCVGFFDTFLSGRISTDATTAIGLAAYVGWLASLIFGLVGAGTTALVSRAWGASDFPQANRVMNRSIALAVLLGGLVYGFIYTAAPGLAALLGMQDEPRRIAIRYLRIDGLGHLFTSVSLIGAAALRGSGNMRSPMFILGLVSVLNVIISSALVYGIGPIPKMGIDGIVAGTVTARFCGGALMLAALTRGLSGLKLLKSELTFRGDTVRRILRIGMPAVLDGGVMWTGHLMFLVIIANLSGGQFGSAAFAAHIVGIQVEAITYLPAVAWGFAAATMVGQSLGASDPERAKRAGQEAVWQCSWLAGLISVLFFTCATSIYGFMHKDASVREIGIPAFQMMAFFQVPLVMSIIYVWALRGAGDTRSPMLINAFGVLCIRLPVAYVCGIVYERGLFGAWIGMCADVTVRAILVWLRYRRGRWLETKV